MPPAPTILLTRPEAAARRFADDLPGWTVLVAPLMRIVPVAHDAARLSAAPGLVFTSENGVPAAGPGRGRPAICVGPRTAEAARAAGFAVTEGPGDAARMMPMLASLPPGWLHPRGAHVAAELPAPGIVVYDQRPLPLTDAARALLAGAAPVVLPLFSPRSARLAAEAMGDSRAPLWLAAISEAADAAWDAAGGPAPARRAVAGAPTAEGIARVLGGFAAALGVVERSASGAG